MFRLVYLKVYLIGDGNDTNDKAIVAKVFTIVISESETHFAFDLMVLYFSVIFEYFFELEVIVEFWFQKENKFRKKIKYAQILIAKQNRKRIRIESHPPSHQKNLDECSKYAKK